MSLRHSLLASALALASSCLITPAIAQTPQKTKVNSQTDLPRFLYPTQGSASQLLDADATSFAAFEAHVRSDLDSVLQNYDIADKATLRGLLSAKVDMQELEGDHKGELETLDALHALEEKPAAKLLNGLYARARAQAAIEVGNSSSAEYRAAFERNYAAAINALPWDIVADPIKQSYASSRVFSRAGVIGSVRQEIDPAAAQSGALDNEQAWEVLGSRNELVNMLPVQQERLRVLKQYIAAHDVVKPDIWAAREVTLTSKQKLAPVLVAIWDSGIDVSIFPHQLYTDAHPTPSGSHGLAYDDAGHISTSWLHPLTPEQKKEYPEFREDLTGYLDLENGIDSAAAAKLQAKFAKFTPEQMAQRDELDNWLGHYVHGTHCAGIAVRGNAAARLVVARFNDELPYLPFAPTTEWAERMKANFMVMSEYFKSRHVRVVNMSWGDDVAEFETWLSRTGGARDPIERKKRAAELFAIWKSAVEGAIRNAPDTLFVTAAGNSDSDTGFSAEVPPSLELPNLISVGAVNQAGDETSFTSSGATVLLHADGYNVDSYIPGGTRAQLSGTSMASPNVVNLAAKLFALDPSLSPEKVIALMRAGATTSDDGRRHLIDEKRSVALLQAGK